MAQATNSLHVAKALTSQGWRSDVRLAWTAGKLTHIETGAAPLPGESQAALAVSGLANLHSHAFQRSFAGLTERRGASQDNFWSWREAMYHHALALEPDDVTTIARQAYIEMLEAGFTRVGEFHYLHHAPDGHAYDDIGELSARIAEAADETGIGLTLLPVFYAHSGFGGAPPNEAQRRFVNDLGSFERLFQRCEAIVARLDGANLGLAPHSLRAATPEEIDELIRIAAGRPLHIHVAEQTAEVEACLAALGARPVEFLLDRFPVLNNWCCVHSTHMTLEETSRLAASGAVVGLCPITEANLGDGVFPGPEFLAHGGMFGIGSDSNVRINLAEELRTLEYGQRLVRRERNVFAASGGSTAQALFDQAARGGAQALGHAGSGFVVGADADIVTFHDEALEGVDDDDALALWIFAADVAIDAVYARGRQVVKDGAHISRERVTERFRGALRDLRTRAPTNRA